MYATPSLISGQLAYERQRDMLAQASRDRRAREVRSAALAARRAEGSQRRPGRLFRRTRPVLNPS